MQHETSQILEKEVQQISTSPVQQQLPQSNTKIFRPIPFNPDFSAFRPPVTSTPNEQQMQKQTIQQNQNELGREINNQHIMFGCRPMSKDRFPILRPYSDEFLIM